MKRAHLTEIICGLIFCGMRKFINVRLILLLEWCEIKLNLRFQVLTAENMKMTASAVIVCHLQNEISTPAFTVNSDEYPCASYRDATCGRAL
jgi:hypothetical protein